jgi:hypothetical protein
MLKKFFIATYGTVLFLFIFNYINTEMAQDNFLPLSILFAVCVISAMFRLIKWFLRKKN